MKLRINDIELEVEEYPISEGLYKYCDDCKWPFRNKREKYECGMHWRPKTGTKEGFPTSDGLNCLKDDELYQRVVETIEKQIFEKSKNPCGDKSHSESAEENC